MNSIIIENIIKLDLATNRRPRRGDVQVPDLDCRVGAAAHKPVALEMQTSNLNYFQSQY